MNNYLKPFVFLSILTLFLFLSSFELSREMKVESIVSIERGSSVSDIARMLKNEGIIRSEYFFIGYLFLVGESKSLQAGSYRITPDMNLIEIAKDISLGKVIFENITIIEGWTISDIAIYYEVEGFGKKEDILKITGISAPQANLLGVEEMSAEEFDFEILRDKPKESSLEGYLYPDTYRIEPDNPKKLVIAMIKNLESKMTDDILEKIEQSGMNIHQVVTFGSLIEKEVILPEDKGMVSDIMRRRLSINMPLQIDATVNYVTGRKGIDVTISETQVNSPYNTYQNRGLPIGPICNPSIESITAVINPIENQYWYYLSDPETKKTIFSRNHLEHVEAKNKYLR